MKQKIGIIGAGPAGLTAGYLLSKKGYEVVIFESDPQYVGGISRTVEKEGFRFDIGGHRFFSKSQAVVDFWKELLSDDFIERPRMSRIFYKNQFYDYPLKGGEAFFKLGPFESIRCGMSFLWRKLFPYKNPRTFHQWVANQFGERLFEIFFKTYTEKVWGMSCDDISADWAAQRIKGLDLFEVIKSALLPEWLKGKSNIKTLIDVFQYPRLGPGMMWEKAKDEITRMGNKVLMGRNVTYLERADNETWEVVTCKTNGEHEYFKVDHIISSAPIKYLSKITIPRLNCEKMVNRLKYRDFITVALVFEDEQPFPDNWIYIHDPKVKVGRIQNFKSWSPEMVPDEKYSCLGLEYFCFEHDGTWDMPDEKLIEMGLLEISRIGLAKKDTFVKGWVIRQPKAYPVYDDGYKDIISGLKAELDQYPTLHLVGRNGMHKYNNQDHSMMTAMLAVENIVSGFQRYDLWNVNEDAEYHEQYTTGTKEALTSLRMVPQPLKQKAEKVEYTYNKALGAIK